MICLQQGINQGQKNYLRTEIEQLQKIFILIKKNIIMFWYKKSSLSFFEESTYNNNRRNINNDKGIYVSPDSGLLIYDKSISSGKFEFYIQP